MGQLASDTFQRANSNPLSGNWTVPAGSGLQIVTNAVQAASAAVGFFVEFYNGVTWPNDQFSEVTLSVLAAANYYQGPFVRLQGAAQSGYLFVVQGPTGSATTCNLQIITAGVNANLATPFTITPQVGDILRLEVSGVTLTAKQNGSTVAVATDATYASGNAGMGMILPATPAITNDIISAWDGGGLGGASHQQLRVRRA